MGQSALSRMFILHVAILPAVLPASESHGPGSAVRFQARITRASLS
jgi:hypothetical protein